MGFVISTFKIVSILVYGVLALNCFTEFGTHAQLLPRAEVQTLETISKALKAEAYWSVSESSCSTSKGLNVTNIDGECNVNCDCSFDGGTVCHIKTIKLKRLSLTGELPAEFGNLSYLEEIDLTRNYINGSIPSSLSRAPLRILSLLGNRLSGTIPKEIGDISTLKELVLQDNQLEGPLPEELGKLINLERLVLSANYFTGKIPPTFGKFKNLTDFRIDGNSISGSIPSFVTNWTKLERLDIQGTSMEGPIPSNISLLTNLNQLRISDLNGIMAFPDLKSMSKLKRLILRNCSINDSIPDYIGHINELNTLDLSFNRLTGKIPSSFDSLDGNTKQVFLTNNSLTEANWTWIMNGERFWDLSYNNFTKRPPSSSDHCSSTTLNLVSSFSSHDNQSWCLTKDLPCPETPNHKSLFINCGGDSVHHNGNPYEQDKSEASPSHFFSSNKKWGFSSTGVYVGAEPSGTGVSMGFIATNKFLLKTDAEIYNTARIAPLSLKYYGLCLQKGTYKVHLHFAEIMFTDNQTFSSVGRRIFDVSIQGHVVLKDYNIAEKAGGVGKSKTETFDATVRGSTLEIHLYWVGKGTTQVPSEGVYGPLISAITITKSGGEGFSVGAILGVVAASCVVVILILFVLRMKGYLGGKPIEDQELSRLDLQTGRFTLRQMKAATGNFDSKNKIGEGGFGPVYKGVLSDGSVIAVKQLSSKSKQGNREFINEVGMISALEHPNLVRLYGCCVEGNQLLLVYEYMENNSLARALFGSEEIKLDWPTRKKICLGVARGLAYLHEESRLKIVHRDIKATNVLLDKNLSAKISDFGLAKLDEEENTHISTRIAGTIGYMAPEYATRGYLTDKADVYSFGIVALEIVSGKSNTSYRPKEEFTYLLDWAYVMQESGKLLELVDSRLGSNYNKEEALTMLNLGLLCTNTSPSLRPTMTSVVSMMEQKTPVPVLTMKHISVEQDARLRAFEKLSEDSQIQSSSSFSQDSHQIGISMDGSWKDSSFSVQSKDYNHEGRSSSNRLL